MSEDSEKCLLALRGDGKAPVTHDELNQLLRLINRLHINEIKKELADIREEQKAQSKQLSSFEVAANRWKGGIVVLLAIGGIAGWLASVGSNIAKWFH